MLSLFRLGAFALLALSLFQVINARTPKRAPLTGLSNAERLAKRLPLARPRRLYDPHRRVVRADPSATVTSTTAASISSSEPGSSPSSSLPPPPSSSVLSLSASSTDSVTASSTAASSTASSALSSAVSSTSSTTPSSTVAAPAATRTGSISLERINAASVRKRDTFPGYMGSIGMVPNPPGSSSRPAWVYTYVVPSSTSTPIQFNVDMAGYSGYAFGAMSLESFTCPTLGPGSTKYLHVANVRGSSPAGAASCTFMSNNFNNQAYSKTTIFLVDPETDEIDVQWINPDGSIVPAYVVEYTNVQWSYGIFITGDLSTLATAMGTTVNNLNQIQLHFNELPPPTTSSSVAAPSTSVV